MNPYARWGTEHCTSLYEQRYIRPEFVVSVDTSNPDIRRMLEDGLNKAEDMLYEKASFAVEVSAVRLEAFFCFRTENKSFGYSFKIFCRFSWAKSANSKFGRCDQHTTLKSTAIFVLSSLGKHTIDQPQVN